MHFHRVHIEVTNICGLACSFCPPKLQPSKTMTPDFFETIIIQLKGLTKSLAFHMMGDPLTLSNLNIYLDLAHKHDFQVELTTSGYYLNKTSMDILFHPCVRQVNISLNSYNKNSLSLSFDDYMTYVLDMCQIKLQHYPKPFINLRLWNLNESFVEEVFNQILFEKLSQAFDIDLDIHTIKLESKNSLRLASKVLLHFDNYFEWPSMQSEHHSHGTCYGLKSHIGILANGSVVPCCLDGEGVMNLGNLHEQSLETILKSQRVHNIIEGFADAQAVESLCQKCSYKDRFSSN